MPVAGAVLIMSNDIKYIKQNYYVINSDIYILHKYKKIKYI